MCNYSENTAVVALWTNEFNWKVFFNLQSCPWKQVHYVYYWSLFCSWREPFVILDGNKEARWKTVQLEVIVVFSPWPALCNLFYLIMSSKRRPKCLSKHLNCRHLSGLLNTLNFFENPSWPLSATTFFLYRSGPSYIFPAIILASLL